MFQRGRHDREWPRKRLLDHGQSCTDQRCREHDYPGELDRPCAKAAPVLGTPILAPLARRDGELERGRLAHGHDFFDRNSLFGLQTRARTVTPHDPRHDHMIAAAELYLGSLRNLPARMNHQPARRDVEDAGVAPGNSMPEACGHHHAPP